MGDHLFKPQDAHKPDDPERQIWLPVADVIRALAVVYCERGSAEGI